MTEVSLAEVSAEAATGSNAEDSINDNNKKPISSRVPIWWLPWLVFFLMIYIFALFWVDYAILQRYLIDGDWNAALPGLGTTTLRKLTMGGHMTCGAVSLLLGPFQFVPFLRRKHFCGCHRWSGRVYIVCALLSSALGIIFIGLKGKLVGGWNMSLAFFCGGFTNAVVAYQTWKTAREAKRQVFVVVEEDDGDDDYQHRLSTLVPSTTTTASNDIHTSHPSFVHHRNWGIRSYSQILSPMLYRYWYVALSLWDLYAVPVTPERGGVCLEDDTCPDYSRPFDALHCWTYWLFSLAVAEVLIYFLPTSTFASTMKQSGDVELCRMNIPIDQREALLCENDNESASHRQDDTQENPNDTYSTLQDREDSGNTTWDLLPSQSSSSPWTVNLLASTLAVITTAITMKTIMS